jgi:hypothetical protein
VRFVTPGTFLNARDDIYSCMDAGRPLSLPEPLRVLRELFTAIIVATRGAYDRLRLGSPDHVERWRLGVIDIASYAVSSLSQIVERGNLTDEACQRLAAEVSHQAEVLSSTMASSPPTSPTA